MKIIEVGCNIIGDQDGIGKHARLVYEEMKKRPEIEKVELLGGSTIGFSKPQMVFSKVMSSVFSKVEKRVSDEHFDYVIIEYPFAEYNPTIIFSYHKLKEICHKHGVKLLLSMHEYDRVNILRREVVKNFIKNSDAVYVSEPYYLDKLKLLNSQLFLRTIPNHVPVVKREKHGKNGFVYFGLINHSKAFQEMLDAWDVFNKEGKYNLSILTATDAFVDLSKHQNVELFQDLPDKEASDRMWGSDYSIVPVVPSIGFNNSSFISTIQCGCIPIGHFNQSLINEPFVINTEDYSSYKLSEALNRAVSLRLKEKSNMQDQAFEFGKKFTIESTVTMMLDGMKKLQGR